jgi:AmmeMemoRadiSam system protein A
MFNDEEKKFMLVLARRAISHCAQTGDLLRIEEKDLPSETLKEKHSCFVTLRIDGNLRGCVGHIAAILPFYREIIENAASAAFGDPRFSPVAEKEIDKLDIEISALTVPEKFLFSSPSEIVEKLKPGRDGVIIRRGRHSATYLPQVWDEFENIEQFLSALCLKAGLPADDWRKPGMEIETYQVEIIH